MANQTTTKENSVTQYETDASLWQARYRIAYQNQTSLFRRFADWYDVMYTVVTTKNYALWRSKVYIPILASKAWNLIAKFMSLKPGFEVRVRQSGLDQGNLEVDQQQDQTGGGDQQEQNSPEDRANKATLKLEYDYDNPKLDRPIREKLMATLIDATVTGTGLAKVPWTMTKETRYEHPIRSDGTIDMSKEKVTEDIEGYNDLIPVNIFNVFISPAATDLYTSPWLIIKDWKTLDQLKAVNAAKGVEIYKNLDRLQNARSIGDPFAVYKKSRNRLTIQIDPIVTDQTVDFLDIYECYDRSSKTIVTYANAGGTSSQQTGTSPQSGAGGGAGTWVEIRRQKNPYWHGKYPLVRFTVKLRPYDFWGQGIFETTHRLQMAANDVLNHYLDNWNLAVDGMLMAQESAGINDYIVEPGGLITYRTEKPEQFKFPEPNPASLNMVINQITGAIENDTISQYSTGVPDSETDKTRGTKGGIIALQQAADDIVAFMRTNFQQSIKQVGQMWLSNNQQFMTKPLDLVVPKQHKLQNVTVKPEDMQGDMELRVDEASMMPISDDQIKESFSTFIQQAMGLAQASVGQHNLLGTEPLALNFGEIFEEMAEKYGFRNVQSFLGQTPPGPTPAQQMQQQQMQQQSQQAQGPPQPTTQERLIESLNYKDVPDDIKRQMEHQAGFNPSQTGVNSLAPHIQKANRSVLDMAQHLHAHGRLHPSVLDAIRGHMGENVAQPTGPATPIPIQPPEQPGAPTPQAPVGANA